MLKFSILVSVFLSFAVLKVNISFLFILLGLTLICLQTQDEELIWE